VLSTFSWRSLIAAAPFGLVLVPVVTIAIWLGARTQYSPSLNDFWALLFQAGRFDWSNSNSFKNGFFPPGYGVFLWLVGGKYVLATAYYANLCFAVATLIATYWTGTRITTLAGGICAALLTAFHPLTFSLAMTSGPDMGCVFMLWTAFCLLQLGASDEDHAVRRRYEWLAGLLCAIAILWRYHSLIYTAAMLVAVSCVTRGRVPLRTGAGIGVALAILAWLSLLPGFSEQLDRAQAFNVWKALHPVNWYHMPRDVPPTIAEVIRPQLDAFLRVYWGFNRQYLWLLGPPIVAALVTRARQRRAALSVSILGLLYLPLVGVGFSPRGAAPFIPATMLCIGLVMGFIQSQVSRIADPKTTGFLLCAAVLALASRSWWTENRMFIESSIAVYDWRRQVELELRAQGVRAPLQVFGDGGFHFVLHPGPGWYSYLPRGNGGWPRLDLYDIDRIAPELRTDSLDAFIEDCRRNGITHVVLSASSGALLRELAKVYTGERPHPDLRQTATVGAIKIFVIQP
jgi:hypothetical protein